MNVLLALIRKGILDCRWMLGMISGTAFGLCWLFVFFVHRIELTGRGPMRFAPTIAIEMGFWNNMPLFLLMIAIWAIARGSAAVAGEIERGTMDLVISRPIRRSTYLAVQFGIGTFGLVAIVAAMVAGNLVGAHYNPLKEPPSAATLARPALNLAAYGWAIFGYSFFLSTLDHVRWRPTTIASVATLAGYIAFIVARIPQLDEDWRRIDRISIFRAVDLLDAANEGQKLGYNLAILGTIGAVGVIAGFVAFSTRDLPAGS